MKDDERVLDAIKRYGPLRASGFSLILKLPEKRGVRSAIDRLREKGEPIWNDPTRGAFWWAMMPNRAPLPTRDGKEFGRTRPVLPVVPDLSGSE